LQLVAARRFDHRAVTVDCRITGVITALAEREREAANQANNSEGLDSAPSAGLEHVSTF